MQVPLKKNNHPRTYIEFLVLFFFSIYYFKLIIPNDKYIVKHIFVNMTENALYFDAR